MRARRPDHVERPLLAMLRVGLMLSTATAGFNLAMALLWTWAGSQTAHVAVGVLAVALNVAVYRHRVALYEYMVEKRGKHTGWPAAALSLIGGVLLLIDGGQHSPHLAAFFTGTGLAAGVGRVGWSFAAAAILSGFYLAGLELRGYSAADAAAVINATIPFGLALAFGGAQWWFAKFTKGAGTELARQLVARDLAAALGPGRLPLALTERAGQPLPAAKAERSRRVARTFLPNLTASPVISPLTVEERVALLSRRQREIARLFARGLRTQQVADRLGFATRTVERERRAARELARASTYEQVVRMVVEIDARRHKRIDEQQRRWRREREREASGA